MNSSMVNARTGLRKVLRFAMLLILASLWFGFTNYYSYAQDESLIWTPQQRIPGYLDRTEQPILIADSMGIVHAFAYQQVGDPDERRERAIIYSTWSIENGWTLPTDIILSPIKHQARVMDVYLDPQGFFHLIFYGGDEDEANLYYSRSHISQAYRSQFWTDPAIIGKRALTPSMAKLAGDRQGNLIALYSGDLDGPGIFKISSTDGGETWDNPEPFFLTYGRNLRPFALQMKWGDSNVIHVVWQISNERGHNIAGYYSQIDSRSGRWREPVELDDPIGVERGMGLAEPSVIEYNDEIFVMYNNGIPPTGVPPGLWFRRSSDGGLSWSVPVRPFSRHVGRNGAGSFVIDGSGQLRVFFGQRVPQGTGITDIHGMWHSVWQGSTWSEPEAVVSAPIAAGFDPGNNHAVVSRGNVLLVVWRTDPGNTRPAVWYSYTILNSTEFPRVALPTFSEQEASEKDELGQTSLQTTPVAPMIDNGSSNTESPWQNIDTTIVMSPVRPMLAGSVAASTVVVLTIVFHFFRRRDTFR
jgi:hypothetical protein